MANLDSSKGFLNKVEKFGNQMPNITMLFLYALVICMILSLFLSFFDFDYQNPVDDETLRVINLLSYDQLIGLATSSVDNFMDFPPLGIVIVATLGIGIADSGGFIGAAIKRMTARISRRFLAPTVACIGIVAHLATDSAYVFLMPAAAMIFYAMGRHPLAGIAVAFAGLAGGFTASYTPSIIDPIMQSFTQDAARIIDSGYDVNVLSNYFYSLGATFGVIIVCWIITDRIVEPWLEAHCPINPAAEVTANLQEDTQSPREKRAFRLALSALILLVIGLCVALWPAGSPLRAPDGSITSSRAPVMQMIVPLLLLFFAVPGLVHGYLTGHFKSSHDVVAAMEQVTKSLIPFVIFAFFAAQFLYAFKESNIGTLLALSGADLLKSMQMPPQVTVLGVIVLTAFLNILITSATSKWAVLAPVLVPMLMSVDIAPELTQAAFRVSDSAVNVSTPMFAFYPLILTYCRQYCRQTGIGTICSMMLPFTFGLLIALTGTLYLFWFLGLPLGFESGYVLP